MCHSNEQLPGSSGNSKATLDSRSSDELLSEARDLIYQLSDVISALSRKAGDPIREKAKHLRTSSNVRGAGFLREYFALVNQASVLESEAYEADKSAHMALHQVGKELSRIANYGAADCAPFTEVWDRLLKLKSGAAIWPDESQFQSPTQKDFLLFLREFCRDKPTAETLQLTRETWDGAVRAYFDGTLDRWREWHDRKGRYGRCYPIFSEEFSDPVLGR